MQRASLSRTLKDEKAEKKEMKKKCVCVAVKDIVLVKGHENVIVLKGSPCNFVDL